MTWRFRVDPPGRGPPDPMDVPSGPTDTPGPRHTPRTTAVSRFPRVSQGPTDVPLGPTEPLDPRRFRVCPNMVRRNTHRPRPIGSDGYDHPSDGPSVRWTIRPMDHSSDGPSVRWTIGRTRNRRIIRPGRTRNRWIIRWTPRRSAGPSAGRRRRNRRVRRMPMGPRRTPWPIHETAGVIWTSAGPPPDPLGSQF